MPLQVLATARQALVQLAPLLAPGEQLSTEVQVRLKQAWGYQAGNTVGRAYLYCRCNRVRLAGEGA